MSNLSSKWSLFVVVIGVTHAVIAPFEALALNRTILTSCDPVQSLLQRIVIGPLPDICLNISDFESEVCLEQLTCSVSSVGGIYSAHTTVDTVYIEVHDIALFCEGIWRTSFSLSLGHSVVDKIDSIHLDKPSSGELTLVLSNLTSLFDVEISPTQSTPALPYKLQITNCDVTGGVFDIHFQGGGELGSFLDKYIAGTIDDILEKSMEWIICDIINPAIADLVTDIIRSEIDPRRMKMMSVAPPPPPVNMEGYLNWNTTFLHTLHQLTSAVRLHGADGLRCMLLAWSRADDLSSHSTLLSFMNMFQRGLDGARGVDIPLSPIAFPLGEEYELVVDGLTVNGLYTLESVSFLEPIYASNVGLRFSVAFSVLDIRLSTLVESSGDCQHNTYSQRASLDVRLLNVTAAIDLVVAMNSTTLGSIYGDQMLNLSCLATALDDMFISSFVLDTHIDELSITLLPHGDATDLEFDVSQLLTSFADEVIGDYSPMVTAVLKGVAQGPLKEYLNERLAAIRTDGGLAEDVCPLHGNYSGVDWLEWTDSTLIANIDYLLNTLLGADGLNNMMDCLTNDTGVIVVDISPTSLILPGFTVTVSGLDSFNEFEMVFPVPDEPYDLGTFLSIGGACSSSVPSASASSPTEACTGRPLVLHLEGVAESGKAVSMSLELTGLQFYIDVLIELDMNTLRNMQASVLSTNNCFLMGVDALSVFSLLIDVSDAALIFDSRSDLSRSDADRINITSILSKVFSRMISPAITTNINARFASSIAGASALCSASSATHSKDPNSAWWSNQLMLGLVGSAVTVAVFLLGAVLMKRRNSRGDSDSEPSSFSVEVDRRLFSDSTDKSLVAITTDSCAAQTSNWLTPLFSQCLGVGEGSNVFEYDALIVQSGIPLWARISLPLGLLAAMGLFTWSNMTTLATINGTLVVRGQEIDLGELFDFSFQETVQDMWDAKVYMLAVLLVFSSGLWPYCKLFLTLLAFVLPSRVMSLPVRDGILLFYDTFGKYSLIDIFLMVLLMVAFHFDIFITHGVEIIAFVVPKWSFYAFLLGTMISLLLGHWAVYLHRSVSESCTPPPLRDFLTSAVSDHVFTVDLCIVECKEARRCRVPYDEDQTFASLLPPRMITTAAPADSPLRPCDSDGWRELKLSYPNVCSTPSTCILRSHMVSMSTLGKVAVAAMLVVCVGAVAVGCLEQTFSFHFKGLVGYLLGDDAVAPYSVYKIGRYIPSASKAPNSLGIRWMQMAFFGYATVMPLLFLCAMLFLWVVPLCIRQQKFTIVVAEVICAWSGLDVFVLALVVSLYEISQFVEFIIGDACDDLNKILKAYRDDELDGDDKCFDVTTTLKKDAWMLYFSAIFLLLAGMIILNLCRTALAQRLDWYYFDMRTMNSRGDHGSDFYGSEESSLFLGDSSAGVAAAALSDRLRNTSVSSSASMSHHGNGNASEQFTAHSPLLSKKMMMAASMAPSVNMDYRCSSADAQIHPPTLYSLLRTHAIMFLWNLQLLRCELITHDA